jgi:hypothetical protein
MQWKYLIYPTILASTYLTNAIVSPLYAANCVQVMNFNSPICASALSIMMGAASLNYWTYYISITSAGIFILSRTIGRGK